MWVEPTDSSLKINKIAGEVMVVSGTYDATLMKYFCAPISQPYPTSLSSHG